MIYNNGTAWGELSTLSDQNVLDIHACINNTCMKLTGYTILFLSLSINFGH